MRTQRRRVSDLIQLCNSILRDPNLEELFVLALRRLRKERVKRKQNQKSDSLVRLEKQESYILMMKADLTEKQFLQVRKELRLQRVIISSLFFVNLIFIQVDFCSINTVRSVRQLHMQRIADEIGFAPICDGENIVGATVDLTRAVSFLIQHLNLPEETRWKIGADGRPNRKLSETAVYISSLSGDPKTYQSPVNVFPVVLLRSMFSTCIVFLIIIF